MKPTNLLPIAYLLLALTSCQEKPPFISAIDPKIGMMGDVVSIAGEKFGSERNGSYITIAGKEPTSSAYLEWTDTLIRLRLPESGEAGLIYIHKNGQKSNPVLFSNKANIPEPTQATESGSGPRIDAVKPNSAGIGSLISIQGKNFGASSEEGGVFFTWSAETRNTAAEQATTAIEPFDSGVGYELWSNDEIRVRIPDGAASGNLEVRTAHGNSTPVFFNIIDTPGYKIFKNKRTYTISYSVNIQVQDATTPNTLYLWVPRPVRSSSQPNSFLINRNVEPFVDNYRGTSLYQLKDLTPESNIGINISYAIDVYSIETSISPQSIKQQAESLPASYVQATPLIPSDDQTIKTLAAGIVGKERNPYIKAQKIYEWLIANANVQTEMLFNSAVDALEQKQADSYSATLLFCALSRSQSIPAIPIAGILVDKLRNVKPHYWAEFWIDGSGWVPVDLGLGSGAAPADFNLREDAGTWYFGNMDDQRISFSRGQNLLSHMDPRGRFAVRKPDYALQDFWEEAVGGLESYSSLWSDITITGMYTQ
jgi:transglutaminase-like putative cysteine protease